MFCNGNHRQMEAKYGKKQEVNFKTNIMTNTIYIKKQRVANFFTILLLISLCISSCKKDDDQEQSTVNAKKYHFTEDPNYVGSSFELAIDNSNIPWVVTFNQIQKLNGNSFSVIDNNLPFDATMGAKISAVFDENDHLWLSVTSNKIWKFDGSWTSFEVFPTLGHYTTKLFIDKDGNLISGTSNGLYKFENTEFVKVNGYDGIIAGIKQDDEGNLWFGTEHGAANEVCKYDGAQFEVFSNVDLYRPVAIGIYRSNIYFGSDPFQQGSLKLLKYDGNNFSVDELPNHFNQGVKELISIGDKLWIFSPSGGIGTNSGTVVRMTNGNWPSDAEIKEDRELLYYEAGVDGSIYSVKYQNGKIWVLSGNPYYFVCEITPW